MSKQIKENGEEFSRKQHGEEATLKSQEDASSQSQEDIENNILGDSELESQMDDFKIDEGSDADENFQWDQDEDQDPFDQLIEQHNLQQLGKRFDKAAASASGIDTFQDNLMSDDAKNIVYEDDLIRQMEEYHNLNYKAYDVLVFQDFIKQRIFRVVHDQQQNFVYVFVGKIKQLSGKKLVEGKFPKSRKQKIMVQSLPPDQVEFQNKREFREIKVEMEQDRAKEHDLQLQALQVFAQCDVQFTLYLQIWNLDDRVMRDMNHRKRPIVEIVVLQTTKYFEKQMTSFCQMNVFQNKYSDYAQLIQLQPHIIFYKDFIHIALFNTITHKMNLIKNERSVFCRKQIKENLQFMKSQMHVADPKKQNQDMKQIHSVAYIQNPKEVAEKQDVFNNQAKDSKPKKLQAVKQSIYMRTTSMNIVQDAVDMFDMINKNCRIKQQTIDFKDEFLAEYCLNHSNRILNSFFLQRIEGSSIFILVFPTGLLMQISSSPLTLQYKIQLNLKRDESIVDVKYCVSKDNLNQTFWFLDEKFQIWKCVNELSPNSSNWTLMKITQYDSMNFKQFIEPSMTYDDFYLCDSFIKLESFNKSLPYDIENMQFEMKLDPSCTKLITVMQPQFQSENLLQIAPPDFNNEESLQECLQRRLRLNLSSWQKLKIKMVLISKKQHLILNRIKEKKASSKNIMNQMTSKDYKLIRSSTHVDVNMEKAELIRHSIIASQQKGHGGHHGQKDMATIFKEHSIIKELIFIGKFDLGNAGRMTESQSIFLIRRLYRLDVMYTNGVNFAIEILPDSVMSYPAQITGIKLSEDRKLVVMYYIPKQRQPEQIKIFTMNCSKRYVKTDHPILKNMTVPKNIQIKNSKLIELKFNLASKSYLKDNFKNHIQVDIANGEGIYIQMPKQVLIKDFLNLEHEPFQNAVLSENCRLIWSGKVVIQFNSELDEVQNIGCFHFWKDNSFLQYSFLSLLENNQRSEITRLMRTQPNSIVDFSKEKPPITPKLNKNVVYAMNQFDKLTGETSIIQIDSESLACYEIYQSKFTLTNMAIYENMADQPEKPNQTASRAQRSSKQPAKSKSNNSRKIEVSQFDLFEAKQQSKIIFSLVSDTHCHINVEIISHSWPGYPLVEEDDNYFNQANQNLKEGGDQSQVLHEGGDHSVEQTLISKTNKKNQMKPQGDMEAQEEEKVIKSVNPKMPGFLKKKKKQIKQLNRTKAKLEFLIVTSLTQPSDQRSFVSWINQNNFIINVSGEFFLTNLKQKDLVRVQNNIKYGRQQINMNIFCSLTRKIYSQNELVSSQQTNQVDFDDYTFQTRMLNKHIKELIQSQLCIMRMELATLRRFSHLLKIQQINNKQQMSLIFFTPSEELHGSNMFSRLANNFNIIQPYLDMIDKQFIELMNQEVYNINSIIKKSQLTMPHQCKSLENTDRAKADPNNQQVNGDLFDQRTSTIHMYMSDIANNNAIDYAFKKDAIYCIGAFVDTLLFLSDESQFRNCFDHALLLMIERDLDVKELISSQLFFAPIWSNYSVFAQEQEPVIFPFNCIIEELIQEDPNKIFAQQNQNPFEQSCLGKLLCCFNGSQDHDASKKDDAFEMQFNYIYLEKIQGDNKLRISRILKDCDNLELFEMDPIQHIIDYKWETYTYSFFLKKFLIYSVFLIFYYIDIERGLNSETEILEKDGHSHAGGRVKDILFFVNKGICIVVQTMFVLYEMIQLSQEGRDYFLDFWNYMEVIGIIIFYIAAVLDIIHPSISNTLRILWSFSVMFSLIKIIYLVRVFKQLNFLVTMVITVVNEVQFFMLLFSVFLLTFAECNHIMQVDVSCYGRTPMLLAHFFGVLRLAMGDQANVDPYESFDRLAVNKETNQKYYIHTEAVVFFTFFIWIIQNFFLFMVFMNFIIAVIGESYTNVVEFKVAHDYHQRIQMIYERELHFNHLDMENEQYFPQIIVVRQKKRSSKLMNQSSLQKVVKLDTVMQVLNQIQQLRNNLKTSQTQQQSNFSSTMRELKMHLTNTIKIIEADVHNINKEQDKMNNKINILTETFRGSNNSISLTPKKNSRQKTQQSKKRRRDDAYSDYSSGSDDDDSSGIDSDADLCGVAHTNKHMYDKEPKSNYKDSSYKSQRKQAKDQDLDSQLQFVSSDQQMTPELRGDQQHEQLTQQSMTLNIGLPQFAENSDAKQRDSSTQNKRTAQPTSMICSKCFAKEPNLVEIQNQARRSSNYTQGSRKEVNAAIGSLTAEVQEMKQQMKLMMQMHKQGNLLMERNIIYNQKAIIGCQQQAARQKALPVAAIAESQVEQSSLAPLQSQMPHSQYQAAERQAHDNQIQSNDYNNLPADQDRKNIIIQQDQFSDSVLDELPDRVENPNVSQVGILIRDQQQRNGQQFTNQDLLSLNQSRLSPQQLQSNTPSITQSNNQQSMSTSFNPLKQQSVLLNQQASLDLSRSQISNKHGSMDQRFSSNVNTNADLASRNQLNMQRNQIKSNEDISTNLIIDQSQQNQQYTDSRQVQLQNQNFFKTNQIDQESQSITSYSQKKKRPLSSQSRESMQRSQNYQKGSGYNNMRSSHSSDLISSPHKNKKSIKSNKNY